MCERVTSKQDGDGFFGRIFPTSWVVVRGGDDGLSVDTEVSFASVASTVPSLRRFIMATCLLACTFSLIRSKSGALWNNDIDTVD
jgi:hypothetical protein